MTWQLLLAISLSTYSVGLLLQRLILKDAKSDPVACSIVVQLAAGSVLGIFSLAVGVKVENFLAFLPNFILMVVLYGASNILVYNALKYTEASIFTILNASRACWSIAAAVVFLNEQFNSRQAAGTCLVIFSVILVSWRGQRIKLNKGEMLTVLAAFTFGIEFINDAYLLQHFDVKFYLPIAFILPALAVWLTYLRTTSEIIVLYESGVVWKLILLGCLYAISAATIFLAYQYGRNAAQIAPINETSTILIVILAAIFLKERSQLLRKLFAAAISVLGVLLIK